MLINVIAGYTTSLPGYSDPSLNADTVFSTQKPWDYDNNQAYFIFSKWKQFSFDYEKFRVKFSDTITKFEKKVGEAAADSDGLCPPCGSCLGVRLQGAFSRAPPPHPGMEVGGSLEGWCPRGQPWAQLGSFPSWAGWRVTGHVQLPTPSLRCSPSRPDPHRTSMLHQT